MTEIVEKSVKVDSMSTLLIKNAGHFKSLTCAKSGRINSENQYERKLSGQRRLNTFNIEPMTTGNITPSANQTSCPKCCFTSLIVILANRHEQCVLCKPSLERTRSIHVSYMYLEVMTAMAVAEFYLGNTSVSIVDNSTSLI